MAASSCGRIAKSSVRLRRRSVRCPLLLNAACFGIEIFGREQAGLPYDRVCRSCRESAIPGRQLPQHPCLDRRLDVECAYVADGQTYEPEPAAPVRPAGILLLASCFSSDGASWRLGGRLGALLASAPKSS